MSVQVGPHGLYVNEKFVPIYSGTVHYWRLEPMLWEPILQQVRDLGFRMIETYIPWGLHEVAPGQFDFGEQDPYKNLPRFLDLCKKLEISVCVRPGPHINAELTWFGFPQRVLADPAVAAHTSTGAPAITDRLPQPFAVPSYASEKLFAEVGVYFDALCKVLIPYLAPDGPIVACQVDNENCYFFRTLPYDMDYSADSIRLYHRMLSERYESINALNAVYGSSYTSFDQVEPPRDFEAQTQQDVPRHLDWVAYKEYQVITSLERLGTMLRDRGISVPLYHDIAFDITTPIDTIEMQRQPHLDFVGTNIYANQEQYDSVVARRIRYQAGSQHLPFVPEYGAGLWWFHNRTFSPSEQEFFVMTGLMHGLKALNFYMIVERDRWQGSPITRHNMLRPGYADFFRRLSTFVEQTNFFQTEKVCNVLVLMNYELNRFDAAYSTLQNAYLGMLNVPIELSLIDVDLGFHHAPELQSSILRPGGWMQGIMQKLEAAQIEYNLSDTHASLDMLTRYPLIFLPTADFMPGSEQQLMVEYVEQGGHLVIGPALPTLSRQMQPLSVLGQYITAPGTVTLGKGKLTLLSAPDSVEPSLLEPYRHEVSHSNPALRLTMRQSAEHRLVFLANPTAQSQQTTLHVNSGKLRGLWNAQGLYGHGTNGNGSSNGSITLLPYSVQVWEMKND